MTTTTHDPHARSGGGMLTACGLFCWFLSLVFGCMAYAEGMNLARLGYVVAVFVAFAVGGLLLDAGDDRAREATRQARGGPNGA